MDSPKVFFFFFLEAIKKKLSLPVVQITNASFDGNWMASSLISNAEIIMQNQV